MFESINILFVGKVCTFWQNFKKTSVYAHLFLYSSAPLRTGSSEISSKVQRACLKGQWKIRKWPERVMLVPFYSKPTDVIVIASPKYTYHVNKGNWRGKGVDITRHQIRHDPVRNLRRLYGKCDGQNSVRHWVPKNNDTQWVAEGNL